MEHGYQFEYQAVVRTTRAWVRPGNRLRWIRDDKELAWQWGPYPDVRSVPGPMSRTSGFIRADTSS